MHRMPAMPPISEPTLPLAHDGSVQSSTRPFVHSLIHSFIQTTIQLLPPQLPPGQARFIGYFRVCESGPLLWLRFLFYMPQLPWAITTTTASTTTTVMRVTRATKTLRTTVEKH